MTQLPNTEVRAYYSFTKELYDTGTHSLMIMTKKQHAAALVPFDDLFN